MRKLIAVMAFLGLTTSYAATGTVNSETFFQAAPGTNVLTPELDYNSQSGDVKANNNDLADVGPTVNFTYERGFNENFAGSFTLGYKQGTQEANNNEADKNGLTDLRMTFKGQTSFVQDSSLHYGGYFNVSPGNKETDAKGDTTAQTGGMSITPYVGYQWLMGSNVLGVKYTQTIWGSDRDITDKTVLGNRTENGGGLSELKAFYEMPLEKWNLGFSAQYKAYTPVKVSDETATMTGYLGGSDTYTSSLQLVGGTFYPTWNVNETTSVVGSLGYHHLLTKDAIWEGQTLDGGAVYNVTVGGRFAF